MDRVACGGLFPSPPLPETGGSAPGPRSSSGGGAGGWAPPPAPGPQAAEGLEGGLRLRLPVLKRRRGWRVGSAPGPAPQAPEGLEGGLRLRLPVLKRRRGWRVGLRPGSSAPASAPAHQAPPWLL
ncbi:hypothetical protein GCM10010376_05740 [Streptomyces violaceusniger]